MAFTFYSPPTLTAEQVSPLGNLLKNSIQKYMLLNQAELQPKLLKEELIKNQLFNKYYGPERESLIAGRQAEMSKLPLQKQLLEAQIQSAASLASKRKAIQDLLISTLSGTASPMQGPALNNPDISGLLQGQGAMQAPSTQQQFMQSTPNEQLSQTQQERGLNYPQAALLEKELFGTQPKFIEVNGQHLAVTPFGNIPIAKGLTAEEKATEQGLGKYKAKLYGDSIDAFRGYQNQQAALDALTDAVENNPEFRNVTGRIKQPLTNWLGTPEQKQLLGSLQSSSGEIALQVAPALKGAFTGRDQALINTIKASPNDFPDVFIGKLKAQKLINAALSERAKLTAELIEKGSSPLQASEMAAKKTPLSRFKSAIDKLTTHHRNNLISSSFQNNEITPEEAREELARRQAMRQRNG
jgi:hypothetical protein